MVLQKKTEYEKYQIKRIVQDLSESIPQLADAWDEESGSIKLTNEQITALIGNQEAYIIQSAAIEAKEESMKALFEAEMNVAKAESAYNEAAQKSDEVIKKNNESIESTGIAIDGYEYKLSRAMATEDEARDALDEAAKAQKKAKEEVDNTTAAADAAAQKIEEYGITLDTTTAASEEMASAQEDASSSIDESANIISDATVRIAEKYVRYARYNDWFNTESDGYVCGIQRRDRNFHAAITGQYAVGRLMELQTGQIIWKHWHEKVSMMDFWNIWQNLVPRAQIMCRHLLI